MADESTQTGAGGGSGTAVAEQAGGGSREGSGGVISSESLVTPEIQSKFDEVFGGKDAAADRESGSGQAKGQQRAQQKPQRQQRKQFFDGQAEPETEAAPESNLAKQDHAGDNVSRSRVDGNQPANQGQQQLGTGEDESSTLSPILRQAAMRARWEPEVIDQLWAENPELAERTFNQLHRSQNELSAQFARFGQQPPQQQQQSQQPPRGQSVNPATAPMQSPEDVMRLMTEVYGGEQAFQKLNSDWNNAVPALIQPMVQSVIVPMQQMLQQAMAFIGGQERQNIAKEASMFLDGLKKEKAFGAMYGLDTKTPSPVQQQAMRGLTMTADQIRVGARAQGVQMSVSEALERAHLMFAANHYQEVERQRLTERIKKRGSNITQRPTQRRDGTSPSTTQGQQRTIKGAEEAYAARLAELGIE